MSVKLELSDLEAICLLMHLRVELTNINLKIQTLDERLLVNREMRKLHDKLIADCVMLESIQRSLWKQIAYGTDN